MELYDNEVYYRQKYTQQKTPLGKKIKEKKPNYES